MRIKIIIITMVTFLNGDVTLSHKAVVEERFDSTGQLSKRSLDPVYMEWGTPV